MRATKINRASFTKPGHALMFVVDEVGQFVARDTQKMLDLQAIVQQLGVKGRGKYWIAVTSQERLSEVVSGLDDRRIELPKLMDRFPLQVHLEPSDISEVTSRRVLAKKAPAETLLGKLYDDNRARLDLNSRITADIKLPALTRENFVDLYPLLPYQIELIIDIVSGLRMQGGASKHVGGANRTIIKLAQQLLINPATKVSEAPIGTRPPGSGLRSHRGQYRLRSSRQDHFNSHPRATSAGAGGRQGGLPAPVSGPSTGRRRISPPRSSTASMPTPS